MGDIHDEDNDLLDLFDDEKPNPSPNHCPGNRVTQQPRPGSTMAPSSNRSPYSCHQNYRPSPKARPGSAAPPAIGLPPSPPSPPSQQPTPSPSARRADFVETFSGMRVRNRLLSADDMVVRMKGRAVHRLAGFRSVPARALESQDPTDAWATLGVLVSKSPRRQSAKGGSYSIWTLSDLAGKENDVSLFLFQEALSSHWTVCEGMLVAVLSPKVLPDKDGNAQRLALSVDATWQINRVGMSMDYGLCKGKRKDGQPCTMPVDKTKGGGYCEFHVVAAFNRAQRKDPLKNKPKGSTSGSTSSTSMMSKLNGAPAQNQQRQNHFQARTTLPANHSKTPSHRAQAPPPSVRPSPVARTLSGILGDVARRREDVGTARAFGTFSTKSCSSGSSGGSAVNQAKPLRPSAVRASGRTTLLSSSLSHPASAGGSRGAGAGAGAGAGTRENRLTGSARVGKSSANSEDVMKLPWAYGSTSTSSSKGTVFSSRRSERQSASEGAPLAVLGNEESRGDGVGGTTSTGGVGVAGQVTGKKKTREGALGEEAPPPLEAHPAGYTSGSVVVPAESRVFSQMPKRFPTHSDGSRTSESAQKFADIQVLMAQRAVKQKAESLGVLLRPQDPNAGGAVGNKLGVGKKRAGKPGVGKSANSVLGVGGGGAGDPFTKKLKTMSAVEKEVLLRRVSKYAGLAEEERAKDADRSMQRLEQREAMADKTEEVTKMTVTVFDCRQCKTRHSRFSKRCRDLGHDQKGVKATLRFFECTNCRKRCSSTERIPQTGCESCGSHGMWKRCGARPGRGPADGPRDKRFVAAVSEWTDQRDLSLAAPDFR